MIEILLAIGVPLMAGFVLTLLRAIALQRPLTLETSHDVALDMTFLAVGAAGSVFNDTSVRIMSGQSTTAWLLGLIFADLIVASSLLYLRRFVPIVKVEQALLNLLLGSVPLLIVVKIIYAGSRHH